MPIDLGIFGSSASSDRRASASFSCVHTISTYTSEARHLKCNTGTFSLSSDQIGRDINISRNSIVRGILILCARSTFQKEPCSKVGSSSQSTWQIIKSIPNGLRTNALLRLDHNIAGNRIQTDRTLSESVQINDRIGMGNSSMRWVW